MFKELTACPACCGTAKTIHERSYADLTDFLSKYYKSPISLEGTYRLDQCLRCSTIYQAFRPDASILKPIYELLAGQYLDWPNERDRSEIASAKAFLGRQQLRTLDFGMGSAAWAGSAKEMGCESHGVEFSDKWMRRAASLGIITNDEGTFDFINTEQVFEHLVTPKDTASYLIGKLRPGGILKISVPKCRAPDMSGDPPHTVHPLEHLNLFTAQGLAALTGLREVRPSLLQRYARRPRRLKEAVRPFWTWNSRKNLYRWFQAPF